MNLLLDTHVLPWWLDDSPELCAKAHAHAIAGLPMHHRDPFDRMLVAQARCEELTLVSRDGHLRKCGIPLVEA